MTMAVTVLIPTPFRHLTGGHEAVDGGDDRGELRPYVNVFVNEEDIRYLHGLATITSGGPARVVRIRPIHPNQSPNSFGDTLTERMAERLPWR
jgi:hypothetical protein